MWLHHIAKLSEIPFGDFYISLNFPPFGWCPFPSLPSPAQLFISFSTPGFFVCLQNNFPLPLVSLTYVSIVTLLTKQKSCWGLTLIKRGEKVGKYYLWWFKVFPCHILLCMAWIVFVYIFSMIRKNRTFPFWHKLKCKDDLRGTDCKSAVLPSRRAVQPVLGHQAAGS